ncbi:unnamed protein product [Amoebophrya sp. A120]|nr:unnamed protein product [Amoebophrya sp. A120]|eukprot:GSA120T00000337001.1
MMRTKSKSSTVPKASAAALLFAAALEETGVGRTASSLFAAAFSVGPALQHEKRKTASRAGTSEDNKAVAMPKNVEANMLKQNHASEKQKSTLLQLRRKIKKSDETSSETVTTTVSENMQALYDLNAKIENSSFECCDNGYEALAGDADAPSTTDTSDTFYMSPDLFPADGPSSSSTVVASAHCRPLHVETDPKDAVNIVFSGSAFHLPGHKDFDAALTPAPPSATIEEQNAAIVKNEQAKFKQWVEDVYKYTIAGFKPFDPRVNTKLNYWWVDTAVQNDNGALCRLWSVGGTTSGSAPNQNQVFWCSDPAETDLSAATFENEKKLIDHVKTSCEPSNHGWKQWTILVLHNDESIKGGRAAPDRAFAVVPISADAKEVVSHELAHAWYALGDEYITALNPGGDSVDAKNFGNCDNVGCPKWQDLIKAELAQCVGRGWVDPTKDEEDAEPLPVGYCAGGLYYAAQESSLMKSYKAVQNTVEQLTQGFQYPDFGIQNERITCCKWDAVFDDYEPEYCKKFTDGPKDLHLSVYCKKHLWVAPCDQALKALGIEPKFVEKSSASASSSASSSSSSFLEKHTRHFTWFTNMQQQTSSKKASGSDGEKENLANLPFLENMQRELALWRQPPEEDLVDGCYLEFLKQKLAKMAAKDPENKEVLQMVEEDKEMLRELHEHYHGAMSDENTNTIAEKCDLVSPDGAVDYDTQGARVAHATKSVFPTGKAAMWVLRYVGAGAGNPAHDNLGRTRVENEDEDTSSGGAKSAWVCEKLEGHPVIEIGGASTAAGVLSTSKTSRTFPRAEIYGDVTPLGMFYLKYQIESHLIENAEELQNQIFGHPETGVVKPGYERVTVNIKKEVQLGARTTSSSTNSATWTKLRFWQFETELLEGEAQAADFKSDAENEQAVEETKTQEITNTAAHVLYVSKKSQIPLFSFAGSDSSRMLAFKREIRFLLDSAETCDSVQHAHSLRAFGEHQVVTRPRGDGDAPAQEKSASFAEVVDEGEERAREEGFASTGEGQDLLPTEDVDDVGPPVAASQYLAL